MSDELKEIPQTGSIIRYAAWNGVILDVFKAELHIYEDLRSGLLLPSNREALMEELQRLNENALGEVDKLLAKIATP